MMLMIIRKDSLTERCSPVNFFDFLRAGMESLHGFILIGIKDR